MQQPRLLYTVAVSTVSPPSVSSHIYLAERYDQRAHIGSSIVYKILPIPQYANARSGWWVASILFSLLELRYSDNAYSSQPELS